MNLWLSTVIMAFPIVVGAAAVWITRSYEKRAPLVRFPEVAAERPNVLNFGYAITLGFVLVAALGTFQNAREAAIEEASGPSFEAACTTMSDGEAAQATPVVAVCGLGLGLRWLWVLRTHSIPTGPASLVM